ncbi:hypothetical protein E8E14_002687 [Neopestalotiopsis sp. 37M]|nr:hypothetical protein E8E14_002687 [Neopestalotiopsis sp. 37M]
MSSKAIDAIANLPGDLVVLPGTEKYDEITDSYFSELERELKPRCFVTPSSATQVSTALQTLKPFANEVKIATCGAGQQATPGVANVHDGITIHLRNLRGIDVDTERKIVSIAAGERMGDVYDAVSAAGFAVAGNRHSSGGIGGDALQGGLSYFSYARGFICDNVVNYEIVLATGEVVNANADSNPDLWIALRGGGNKFGIVTRFDLEIFEQGQLWGGKIFYFQPSFFGQIENLVNYLHEPDGDADIHICLSLGYAAALGDVLCMNDIFCTTPEKPKALEPFADVQPQIDQMRSLRVDNLKAFTDEAFSGASNNRVVKILARAKSLVYPFEDATPSMVGAQSFDWIVATDKNLSASTLFLFNIFYEGDTSPSAVSETFRITDDDSTSSSSTTTASSSTTFVTSASITGAASLTTSTISTTPISTVSTTTSAGDTTGAVTAQTSLPAAEQNTGNDGLSVSAKVGLGIAVPVVALLGIAAGYYIFRHRAAKQQKQNASKLVAQTEPPMYQEPPNPPPYFRYEMDGVNHSRTHELYGDSMGR